MEHFEGIDEEPPDEEPSSLPTTTSSERRSRSGERHSSSSDRDKEDKASSESNTQQPRRPIWHGRSLSYQSSSLTSRSPVFSSQQQSPIIPAGAVNLGRRGSYDRALGGEGTPGSPSQFAFGLPSPSSSSFGSPSRPSYMRTRTISAPRADAVPSYPLLSRSPTSPSRIPGSSAYSTSPTAGPSGTPPFSTSTSLARRLSMERRGSISGMPSEIGAASPNSLQAALQSLDEDNDRFSTSPRAGSSAMPAVPDPPADADEPWIDLPPPAMSPSPGVSALTLGKPPAAPTQEEWRSSFSDGNTTNAMLNSPRLKASASPVPPSLQAGGSQRRGSISSGSLAQPVDPLVPISPPSVPSPIASSSQPPPSPTPSFSIPGFSAFRAASSPAGESKSYQPKKPEDLTLHQSGSALPSHFESRGRRSPPSPHRPSTSAGRRPPSRESRPSSSLYHSSPASAPSFSTSFHIPPSSIPRSKSPLPPLEATPSYQLTRQRSHSPSRTSPHHLLGSPSQRASSSFHRRSPSLGSHTETFLSFLPQNNHSPVSPVLGSRRSPKVSPKVSPKGSPKTSPKVSPEASPRLSASNDQSRPATLTLETMSAFRFGSSPTGSRTPSPHRSPNLEPALQGGGPSMMFPHLPTADLSLPPPSGWNLSDDADLSPLEETDLDENEGYNPFDEGVHLSRSVSHEPVDGTEEAPPSPVIGSIPLPLEGDQWGAPLDFNRSLSGTAIAEESVSRFDDEEPEATAAAAEHHTPDMDEESLTALERIFLFAKSEHVDHRETVSRMLPVWLEQVEICEAVEYILPLFAALAQDEETVREALAERLSDCMWYFFSRCPIVELSAQHQIARLASDPSSDSSLEQQLKLATEQGIQTRIIISEQGLELVETPPVSMSGQDVVQEREETMLHAREAFDADGESRKFTPGTGSTLVSTISGSEGSTAASELGPYGIKEEEGELATDFVDRPSIPVGTFHEVLGLLLMGESGTVSNVVQEAIVHFLLRLSGQPVVPLEAEEPVDSAPQSPSHQDDERRQHEHAPYKFTQSAKAFIRDDLLSNVVVALAKLDSPDKPELVHEIKHAQHEQEHEDAVHAAVEAQHQQENQRFSSFFEDTHMSISPANPEGPSSTGLDAEEGRYICLCLISLIAEMDAVLATSMQNTLLPIVRDLAQDEGAGMRRQCVEALAAMVKSLSSEVFTEEVLPTIETLVHDTAYIVRKLVASSLPDIVRKIEPQTRQADFAVSTARLYSEDASDAVRQGLHEIMGPLIYVFAGSVPDDLVDIFLGKSNVQADIAAKFSPAKFAPLIPAFALPAASAALTTSTDIQDYQLSWDPSKDSERAIITAYNIPGVVLSVGAEGWPRLRTLHHQLATKSSVSRPRLLIASSIHDIAKVIGPTATESDLLPLLRQFGADDDPEVVMRVYERYPEFIKYLPDAALTEAGQILSDCWFATSSRDWRMREVLAESLAGIAEKVRSVQGLQSIVTILLEKVLEDTISSVRTWGTKIVPLVLPASEGAEPEPHQQSCIHNLLKLATHAHHKFRAVFAASMLELVSARSPVPRELENALLDQAADRVTDVRIGVARVLVKLCSLNGRYAQDRPQQVEAALRSLSSDPEKVVSELLQDIELQNQRDPYDTIDPLDEADNHSVDSSDDEDDRSPVSSSSSSARRLAASQAVQSQTQPTQSSTRDSQTPTNQTSSYHDALDQDDAESMVLDDSALSDSDLEELAMSSVYVPAASETSPPSSITPSVTKSASYISLDSLLSEPTSFSSSASRKPSNSSIHSNNSSMCSTKTEQRTSWRFSMRDEEQYVAIDLMV